MDLKNKNIIITAGCTGGHIHPALTIAELLKKNHANIIWIGSFPNSMESKIVPKYFNIKYIKLSKIKKKKIIKNIIFPINIIICILKSFFILKKFKIDLVIGFGSYISGPICLAAFILNKPIIIHEQNAKISLTNYILSKFATTILLAFKIDDLHSKFSNKQLKKTKIVGNPIRKEIIKLNDKIRKYNNLSILKILVLGGSQGAQEINKIIPKLIKKIIKNNINIQVWHQTGKKSFNKTKNDYKNIPANNIKEISIYIKNIAIAYDWADLIICRAGGLTVSECSIAGLPAIFIPLPSATNDHQFFNIKNLINHNAGICLRQEYMTLDNLLDIIKYFNNNKYKLQYMSEILKRIFIKNSSEKILYYIKRILNNNKGLI